MKTENSDIIFAADGKNEIICVPPQLLNNETFSLEYSKTQNAFHVDEISHIIKRNLEESFVPERTNDYKIIFIGSEAQCRELKREIVQAKAQFS